MVESLAQRLNPVVPLGSHIRALNLGEKNMTHLIIYNKTLLLVGQVLWRYMSLAENFSVVGTSLITRFESRKVLV